VMAPVFRVRAPGAETASCAVVMPGFLRLGCREPPLGGGPLRGGRGLASPLRAIEVTRISVMDLFTSTGFLPVVFSVCLRVRITCPTLNNSDPVKRRIIRIARIPSAIAAVTSQRNRQTTSDSPQQYALYNI
jgi:hypothetical protein